MIKNLFPCIAIVLLSFCCKAKNIGPTKADTLLRKIAAMKDDTNKVKAYFSPATKALIDNSDKAITAYTSARLLAKKLSFFDGIVSADLGLSFIFRKRTDYSNALIYAREALEIAKKNRKQYVPYILSYVGHIYYDFQNHEMAVKYHTQSLKGYQELGLKEYILGEYLTLANDYGDWKKYDTALDFDKKALALAERSKNPQLKMNVYGSLSWHYYLSKQYLLAMDYCRKTLKLNHDTLAAAAVFGTIGNIYQDAPDSLLVKMGIRPFQRHQEALKYLKISMQGALQAKYLRSIMLNWRDMSKSYAGIHDYKNAYEAYKNYIVFRDSISNETQQKLILKNEASAREDALQYQQQLSNVKAGQQRNMFIAGIAALLVLLAFIGLNYFNQRRSNRLITLANHELDRQRTEVTLQRDKLNETIQELKATQQQLIQAEKMASLGELTAGIAHEIQNPLNFVNNFSEVSVELLQELKEEVEAGNTEDVLAIADDLTLNLTKINHHGKRADGIVKGMLEHSRTSTGIKEPANLNKLADEYLRLAYHGLRAKDKSFNTDLVTNFADTLPLVNLIPQDVGRVMLNLFNNAFYAVQQKAKTAGADYKPVIDVSTTLNNNHIEITIKDNGTGIPDNIKDKILQPFFTTKPTGEGTGLGLSVSYDIVVKGHGGSIDVQSINGEGATFKLQLPLNKQII